jgi:hypothetical protein
VEVAGPCPSAPPMVLVPDVVFRATESVQAATAEAEAKSPPPGAPPKASDAPRASQGVDGWVVGVGLGVVKEKAHPLSLVADGKVGLQVQHWQVGLDVSVPTDGDYIQVVAGCSYTF